jgi:hypothetical protein
MSTQIGIKKMLHLIWSKDNSSMSEDGKELKGVRSRLLECYRSLYFDPLPDMEPKQQVNRIAKNMIECVGHWLELGVHVLTRMLQVDIRRNARRANKFGGDDAVHDGRRPDPP